MTKDQQADLLWEDGDLPVSGRFHDPYFSRQDGLAEARHVFLAGNGLPGRFRDGFAIAELGFGTGLNFLATCRAWLASGQDGRLSFTSFEAYPMTGAEMARAHARFGGLADLSAQLVEHWIPAGGRFELWPGITLNVIVGDARATLPAWDGLADAWYLDGFSPARNPELWEEPLLAGVAAHMAPGGTLATYSAAGFVRRGLEKAGIAVRREAGYGRKRHMTTGQMKC